MVSFQGSTCAGLNQGNRFDVGGLRDGVLRFKKFRVLRFVGCSRTEPQGKEQKRLLRQGAPPVGDPRAVTSQGMLAMGADIRKSGAGKVKVKGKGRYKTWTVDAMLRVSQLGQQNEIRSRFGFQCC